MELSELTTYAAEKYQIEEQHKWADFPGFSVLCHPKTGKWVALLMRQWDTDTGTEIQCCDLKCGREILLQNKKPYLSDSIRMHGSKWVNIAFDVRTESDVVFHLFDKAVEFGNPHGFTIVLGSELPQTGQVYQETALPFSQSRNLHPKETVPGRLREMRRLVKYDKDSMESRAQNFYRQAVFMEDYEDDFPWSGNFVCYFPTYQKLSTGQLRGYFSWRSKVRKGEYEPIAASAAYLYLYELLNDVGADSPEGILEKMKSFERGYLDSGMGDHRMRQNLRRWMLEYAVLKDLPPEMARQAADPEMIARDESLSVLRCPETYSDEQVFSALCCLGGKKMALSPVLANDPQRGMRLFREIWRAALVDQREENDLFARFFGEKKVRQWYPFANAVYYDRSEPDDRDYVLDDCRSFHRRNRVWQMESYEKLYFDRTGFQGFLHEVDARLRRYLKTGRYLKENASDEWAVPVIDAVIEANRKAELEARRPKVTIDLSGLEQIRRDAAVTRDSLLTEEDLKNREEIEEIVKPASAEDTADLPLDTVQVQILSLLLQEKDPSDLIRSHHLMPSIVADFINEALFDEIGDTVLLCEDDHLSLVEDYKEDLMEFLGGTYNG